MCGSKNDEKKKRPFVSAVCLICSAAVLLTGCAEGGVSEVTDNESDDRTRGENISIVLAPSDGYAADGDELDSAKAVLENRLDTLDIEDYELDIDYSSGRISFRCLSQKVPYNTDRLTARLCERAELTFREGALYEIGEGQAVGSYKDLPVVLDGRDVKNAFAVYNPTNKEYSVNIGFNDSGTEKFSEATKRLSEAHGIISIYLDDKELCRAAVAAHITDGTAVVSGGGFTVDSAKELSDKINAGALPFDTEVLKVDTD